MQVWNVMHAARWNTGRKKIGKNSPSGHRRTTLSGYIFATKAHIDNRKNILSSNISSIRLYNMVNFGPLAAESGPVVWGTPANFNGFRFLATLLHGTLLVGVIETLRRWTESATYIRQGGITWAIIFVVSGGLSVCLSVCLYRVFLSRFWSDFDQTRTYVICLGLVVSPRI